MRKLMLLITIGLLLLGIPTLAQDVAPVFCGDLAEADCAILTDSATAMRELRSAVMAFEVEASAANLPDTRPDSLDLRLTGTGSYHLSGTSDLFTNPNALLENPEALPQMLADLLRSVSGDLTLTVFFGDNVIALASQGGTELPQKVGFSARLVEGFGYLNLSKLAELDTTGDLPHGWVGVDLATVVERALGEVFSQGMDFSTLNMNPADPLATMELMSTYSTIERLEDATVNGQTAAVFQTTIDIAGLLTSDAYREMLIQQMEQTGGDFSDADLEAMIDLIGAMYGGFVMQTTQAIGLDDFYVHQMGLILDWPFDISAMMEAFGETPNKAPAIELGLTATVDLSQFNAAPEITAPEDASVISVEEFLRMMGN
ncbi:MAG: hypothetical protein K8L97_21215 [Anaerolineae bacterium]|nr:hypothetical protein [Anaerolineae bacterium]